MWRVLFPAPMSRRVYPLIWALSAACLVAYLLTISNAAVRGGDFVHLWVGGRAALVPPAGGHLYDPETHYTVLESLGLELDEYWGERYNQLGVFFYPPAAALLYAPLGSQSLYTAAAIMAILNIAVILLIVLILHDLLDQQISRALLLLLLLTYPAIFFNYSLGQNGLLSLGMVLVASWCWVRGKDGWAGAWLGLLLFKPNWLVALGWWPVVQRRWRVVLGVMASVAGLVGLSMLIWGLEPWLTYLALAPRLANISSGTNYLLDEQYTILSLTRRYAMGDGWGWGAMFLVLATAVYQLTSSAAMAHSWRWSMGLAWITAVLLNPHLFHYDVALVYIALLLPLAEWPQLGRATRITLILLLTATHLAFPLTNLFDWYITFPLPLICALLAWVWFLTIYKN